MVDQMGRWYPDFPGQQPYQDPAFLRMMNQQQQQTQTHPQQSQPQAMTPPTIHADIIQVESEEEADRYPMAAGSPPQMFIKRDETAIYIKTILANNAHDLKAYPLRPPKPPTPPVDMGLYVTRDELEKRLAALTAAPAKQKKPESKEAAE